MFIIGQMVWLAFFVLVLLISGEAVFDIVMLFIDLPSLLALAVPLLGIIMATRGFAFFGMGFKMAINPKAVLSQEDRNGVAGLFRLLSISTLIIAIVVFVTSMLITIYNADNDLLVSSMGDIVIISSIVLFYGTYISLGLFAPISFIAKAYK
ncbi:MAG: hypothetical protein FWE05_07545 [Defluviitaleaceae bacterium]|nr:hypothetical protein [Defluviitaleaceae bacterium]